MVAKTKESFLFPLERDILKTHASPHWYKLLLEYIIFRQRTKLESFLSSSYLSQGSVTGGEDDNDGIGGFGSRDSPLEQRLFLFAILCNSFTSVCCVMTVTQKV